MSMLMATPSPHFTFSRGYPWDGARCSDWSVRPRVDNDKVALPSIRQAFPELHLLLQPRDSITPPSSSANNRQSTLALGSSTSPDYVHSPNANKRRRLSMNEDRESQRPRQIPRHYHSPERGASQQISPSIPSRPAPASESWAGSSQMSPFTPSTGLPALSPAQGKERSLDARPTLPALPTPHALQRDAAPIPRLSAPQEPASSSRPSAHSAPHGTPAAEPALLSYQGAGYGYSYQHPTRYQSLSTSSIHPFDRSPFAGGAYGSHYPDLIRFGEPNAMGMGGDHKQRKRRGNLPKETTDKLRAWFLAHLSHPYPTEDEKQELMRQTGLQMNQISNWFINARRRQLPTMINNAQAESEAMVGARSSSSSGSGSGSGSRSGSGAKVLATTERNEFLHMKRETAGPLSDGEGAHYDEDLETVNQRRVTDMSRGSV